MSRYRRHLVLDFGFTSAESEIDPIFNPTLPADVIQLNPLDSGKMDKYRLLSELEIDELSRISVYAHRRTHNNNVIASSDHKFEMSLETLVDIIVSNISRIFLNNLKSCNLTISLVVCQERIDKFIEKNIGAKLHRLLGKRGLYANVHSRIDMVETNRFNKTKSTWLRGGDEVQAVNKRGGSKLLFTWDKDERQVMQDAYVAGFDRYFEGIANKIFNHLSSYGFIDEAKEFKELFINIKLEKDLTKKSKVLLEKVQNMKGPPHLLYQIKHLAQQPLDWIAKAIQTQVLDKPFELKETPTDLPGQQFITPELKAQDLPVVCPIPKTPCIGIESHRLLKKPPNLDPPASKTTTCSLPCLIL